MTPAKGRACLIHWNPSEAGAHAQTLRQAGWQVEIEAEDGAHAGNAIKADPPQVVVIYLSRLPSHGRETALYLRSTKANRSIPIVFVDGKDEAVEKTRAEVPDAIYTTSEQLVSILQKFTQA